MHIKILCLVMLPIFSLAQKNQAIPLQCSRSVQIKLVDVYFTENSIVNAVTDSISPSPYNTLVAMYKVRDEQSFNALFETNKPSGCYRWNELYDSYGRFITEYALFYGYFAFEAQGQTYAFVLLEQSSIDGSVLREVLISMHLVDGKWLLTAKLPPSLLELSDLLRQIPNQQFKDLAQAYNNVRNGQQSLMAYKSNGQVVLELFKLATKPNYEKCLN